MVCSTARADFPAACAARGGARRTDALARLGALVALLAAWFAQRALLASLCSLPRFLSPRFTNSGTAHGRSATRSLRCGHGRCTRREASRRGHLSHADRGQGRVRALENAAHRCSPRVPSTDGARRTARSAICVLGSSGAAHEGGRDLRSSRYERHTRGHTGREKEASALRRRDAADGAKAAGSGVSRCASRAAATSEGQGGVPTCPKRALWSVVPNCGEFGENGNSNIGAAHGSPVRPARAASAGSRRGLRAQ